MKHAEERRGQYFKAGLRGRAAAWALLLGCSAAFLFGAWQQTLLIMLAGPAAVVVGVVGLAYYFASRRAENEFFRHFAASRSLDYWPSYTVLPFTPLLAAGDRQRFEHWMQGPIDDDPPLRGGFGRFIYEQVEHDREGNEIGTSEQQRLTVGVIELEESMARYTGVFLRPRRHVLSLSRDWLSRSRTRAIELESARFTERYELRIGSDQDEVEARRLFAPTLIAWLAEHPLAPGIELKAGTLVVFVQRVLEDDGNLTFFLDALRHIGARVTAEAAETSPV